LLLPFLNSFHDRNKFSREIILSKIFWLLSPPPYLFVIFIFHEDYPTQKELVLLLMRDFGTGTDVVIAVVRVVPVDIDLAIV